MGAILQETSLPFLTTHIAPQQAPRYCLMHLPSCSMQVLVAGFVQILLKAGALHQSINQSIVYVRGTKEGVNCHYFKTIKMTHPGSRHTTGPTRHNPFHSRSLSRDPLIILVIGSPARWCPPDCPPAAPAFCRSRRPSLPGPAAGPPAA